MGRELYIFDTFCESLAKCSAAIKQFGINLDHLITKGTVADFDDNPLNCLVCITAIQVNNNLLFKTIHPYVWISLLPRSKFKFIFSFTFRIYIHCNSLSALLISWTYCSNLLYCKKRMPDANELQIHIHVLLKTFS